MNLITFILVSYALESRAKQFNRCELAIVLVKYGFPLNELQDWVCLIEAESSRRTDAIHGPNEDGSYDYGLFQINSRYWCNTGATPGKVCNLRCDELLTDDITKAVECTKTIYKLQGFEAWIGWVNECTYKNLPNIYYCFDDVNFLQLFMYTMIGKNNYKIGYSLQDGK